MNTVRLRQAAAIVGVATLVVFASQSTSPVAAQVPRDARAPAPPAGRASIAGEVVSLSSGRPIQRASVAITGGEPKLARLLQTDEQGKFTFTGLSAGEYTLTASKGGYVDTIYGQRNPGSGRPGTTIRLTETGQVSRLTIPLGRGGVVTGTVVDDTGEPAFGVSVRALRWVMRSGERTLLATASVTTDDRGVYRLHSLLPGEYVISAAANAGFSVTGAEGAAYFKLVTALEAGIAEGVIVKPRSAEFGAPAPPGTGFATVYYPGTTIGSAAATVTVTVGEERGGIDIPLQVVPLSRIVGTVTSATGQVSGAAVQLVDAAQLPGQSARTARTDGAGRFMFDGVAPGQYTLLTKTAAKGARQLEASGREAAEFLAATADKAKAAAIAASIAAVDPLYATAEIIVDGRGPAEVQLVLQPGMTVSGKVVVDAAAQQPPLGRTTVGLTPVGLPKTTGEFAQAGPAPLEADGNFTIRGVTPGRYRLAIFGGLPAGQHLQSVVFGGQDILDVPLDVDGSRNLTGGLVTVSTRPTEVSGVIRDAAGQPAPGFTVVAFSTEERFWTPESRRIQGTRPANDGRYVFRNLPPGDYRLIAVPDVEPGRWFDPAFLRPLAGFATFTLAAGARHVQDFQIR